MTAVAAVDMFMVATATFKLLYAVIVSSHHRRRVIHFEVTQNPTQAWLAHQITEAFPWDTAPRYLLRDRDTSYGGLHPIAETPKFETGCAERGVAPGARLLSALWRAIEFAP